MKLLLVSIGEVIYLIYMFYFFRTKVDFNLLIYEPELQDNFLKSMEKYRTKITKFIINTNKKYFNHYRDDEIKICLFGRIVIILLLMFLILRHFIRTPNYITIIVFIITFILSLMNINALVYLLPIFAIEIYKLLTIATN